VRLTSPEERDTIFAYVEAACQDLPEEDLHVLGYHDFLDGLTRGIAAHHAGMLPAFKHVVEELYVRGLCKVVFATETLALGINMPARTVVIEKLVKFNGETHADVTPGEYTQLTGRAGRRGLDVEGHAVVLWQPGMNPRDLAGLASTRTYPLQSSFRPSYNMAVNLVHQFGKARSRELLEMSFAQFQADQAVVGLARQLRKAEDALEGYAEAARCHLGDFMEYAALRRAVSDAEKRSAKVRRADRRDEVLASLATLRPGDVIEVPAGRFAGYAVVVDPGTTGEEPRPYVVTAERQARRLAPVDFPTPVRSLARLRVPRNFNGRNPQARRDLASALRTRTHDLAPPPPGTAEAPRRGAPRADSAQEQEIARLRDELTAHPCHACPDREDHARWGERWFKLDRDADTLRKRIENRTNTVARTFDRVCDVLTSLGYLTLPEGEDGEARVTEEGRHLMRLYSESDLVAAEALRHGLWDGLTPAELASVLSALVFEARRPEDVVPRVPAGRVGPVLDEMWRLWRDLSAVERDHRLDFLREPDRGFAWAAYRWAEGDDLDEVLTGTTLAAGDFVRWMKQLVDAAGQVADAAGDTPLRRTSRDAVRLLRRGVVAYSSVDD
jgi:ATP-dependent RNA helicase HelY